MIRLTTLLALAASLPAAIPQSNLRAQEFEVASVKPMLVDDPFTDIVPQRSGDHVRMHNTSLFRLIAWAYDLSNPDYQIVAGPWAKLLFDDYDVQAIAPGSPDDDTLRLMFRTLLKNNFSIEAHTESRDMAAWDLVTDRNGAKLSASPPDRPRTSLGRGGSSAWAEFGNDGKHLVGKGASLSELAVVLTHQIGAPVQDRTGIRGTFDFDVPFSTGLDSSEAPMLPTSLRTLGLTLKKTTAGSTCW